MNSTSMKKTLPRGKQKHLDDLLLVSCKNIATTPSQLSVWLRLGARVNAKSKDGETALILAAEHASLDLIQLLLDSGAHINAKDKDGRTALMGAATRLDGQSAAVIKLLLGAKANANLTDTQGNSALHLASWCDLHESIGVLLQHKGSTHAKNMTGSTPLHAACKNGSKNVLTVMTLLKHGVCPNVLDTEGRSPLWHALSGGMDQQAFALIAFGASTIPDALGIHAHRLYCGMPPIHAAARGGLTKQLLRLLNDGVSLDTRHAELTVIEAATLESQHDAVAVCHSWLANKAINKAMAGVGHAKDGKRSQNGCTP